MTSSDRIDAAAWKAARPAARRVRRRAAVVAALALVAVAALAVLGGSLLLLLSSPLVAWGAWFGARSILAARAVADVRRPLVALPAPVVAALVAQGRAQFGGSTLIAIEDADSVVLTTGPGAGRGPELPLSAITGLGRSDG